MDTNHIGDAERIRALREKNLITEEEMADLLGRASRSEPTDSEALEPGEAQKKAPAKPSLCTRYLVAGLAVLFLGAMFFMAKSLSTSSEKAFQKGFDFERGGEFKEATRWYLKAAQKGHPEAQYRLAGIYYNTEENEDKYFEWLQKSAKNGYPDAALELGEFFQNGSTSGNPDLDEAEKWYRKAVELGAYGAQKALDALEEEKRIALLPKTVQEIPKYFLNKVQSWTFKDYPDRKGYANIDKAFRKFIKDGEWKVLDGFVQKNDRVDYDDIDFFMEEKNQVNFTDLTERQLEKLNYYFQKCLRGENLEGFESFDAYASAWSGPYLVFFDGIGPNLNDESKKARYEIIFACYFKDAIDSWSWNSYFFMNGQIISGGDFLARIYLGSK